jgi:hypothetical protein
MSVLCGRPQADHPVSSGPVVPARESAWLRLALAVPDWHDNSAGSSRPMHVQARGQSPRGPRRGAPAPGRPYAAGHGVRRACAATSGRACRAVATCLASRYATPARRRALPRAWGNTGSRGPPWRSRRQSRQAAPASCRNGGQRCLRPLPEQGTWAPAPSTTSGPRHAVSADTRSPVCPALNKNVRSRRPAQVA